MIGWLDGWVVGWLVGWMVGWLVGWMVGHTHTPPWPYKIVLYTPSSVGPCVIPCDLPVDGDFIVDLG